MSATTPSDVERIKKASRNLRGTLVESLENPVTGAIAVDDTQLSKFHGIYQQDDRDTRATRKRQKLEPAFSFMLRGRLPGGVCTPAQWLLIDELAQEYATQGIRLTTRQAYQFHGIIKRNLKPTIQGINQALMDTIAACGDVNRNVMSSPNPYLSDAHAEVHALAQSISEHLTPQTNAYHEIWLDGTKLEATPAVVEPVYGDLYLPRKFKTALVVPPQNDVDVYTQDLGFIAIIEADKLIGFNVTVGGGMGSSHGEVETYPRLADTLGFCRPEQVLAVATEVVTVQRDFGNRSNRKHARLKYTIDDRGVQWFKGEVEKRLGFSLETERPVKFRGNGDRLGWTDGADGVHHFTLFVPSGRVVDDSNGGAFMEGLREIAKIHSGEFRLTPNQNIIIANIAREDRAAVEELLGRYRLLAPTTPLKAHSMACVALPTCALAMAEAERYLPAFTDRVQALLDQHGLSKQAIVVRITGCPNGCARPFVAEIALVGKAPGRYNLYIGGDFNGQRLNKMHRENIDEAEILATLDPLFKSFSESRQAEESFGDFCIRSGVIKATTAGKNFHDHTTIASSS